MFDKYIICEDGFTNHKTDGSVDGFTLRLRLPYYRGLGLSMVEDVRVTVDGTTYPRDAVVLSVEDGIFTLDEMETAIGPRWEMGEKATVVVRKDGGLPIGSHEISVMESLRISYLPWATLDSSDTKTLTLED